MTRGQEPSMIGLLGVLGSLGQEHQEQRTRFALANHLRSVRAGIDESYYALSQEKQRNIIRRLCGGPSDITEDEVTEVWAEIDTAPRDSIRGEEDLEDNKD